MLDDEEVRLFTLWETDAEIPAFRKGWRDRVDEGPLPKEPAARDRNLYPENQNARVAWERGWIAANAVCKLLLDESEWAREQATTTDGE